MDFILSQSKCATCCFDNVLSWYKCLAVIKLNTKIYIAEPTINAPKRQLVQHCILMETD